MVSIWKCACFAGLKKMLVHENCYRICSVITEEKESISLSKFVCADVINLPHVFHVLCLWKIKLYEFKQIG